VIEARETRGDGLDQPIDASVLRHARSIEIVGHQEDLECPAATDQAGEPGQAGD
jgi:hypothetical protein